MAQKLKQRIDSRLQRIANVLLLNASFIDNLGLLNGKMGIAIFFFQYARYTNNEIYERYAGELIDEIYEEIHQDNPIDFEDGLTGIGWGIEYLVRNSFVEADTDEALSEMDNMVLRNRLKSPLLLENSNSIFGYGLYYLARLAGREHDDENLTTLMKKETLILLTDECEKILIHKRFLDFNIPVLSMGTLNSIAYFLLEMYKLNLFPLKVEKLIHYYPFSVESALKDCHDLSELLMLQYFSDSLMSIVNTPEAKNLYKNLDEIFETQQLKNIPVDHETMITTFVKQAWNLLLYRPYPKNALIPVEKVIEVIDIEENWNKMLDSLNKDNMGLNNGMAGLGLALLNEEMKALKNEKI